MRRLLFALAVFGIGCVLGAQRLSAQSAPAQSSLESEVRAQRILIDKLETRVLALERSSAASSPASQAAPLPKRTYSVLPLKQPPIPLKPKLADLGPDLTVFGEHRSHFMAAARIVHGSLGIPTAGPTAMQQFAEQQAQLAAQLNDMKNELVFDESYLYGSMSTLRTNVNTIGNTLTSIVDDWPRGICTGMNAYMTLGTIRLINNTRPGVTDSFGQCFNDGTQRGTPGFYATPNPGFP